MIILDTNVVSEIIRSDPAPVVLNWAESQPSSSFCTTAITKAEIYYGLRSMAQGKRRRELEAAADKVFSVNLGGRIIAFDSEAAIHYASLVAMRQSMGLSISKFDCQIAAIALLHNEPVATRNIRDFEGIGLTLINPWEG